MGLYFPVFEDNTTFEKYSSNLAISIPESLKVF